MTSAQDLQLAKRLSECKPQDRNHGEWADMLGISRQTWSTYINATARPSLTVLLKLHKLTDYNLDWILFGKAPAKGIVDRDQLVAAVTGALNIADSAQKRGKDYKQSEVASFVVDIYEASISKNSAP